MSSRHLRSVAMALALAWACWWVFFEVAEGIGDRQFGQAIVFVVAMFGAVIIAWRWPVIGAMVFLLEGVLSAAIFAPHWAHRFRVHEFLVMFAMMPLPPLAAGVLLLLSVRKPATRGAGH